MKELLAKPFRAAVATGKSQRGANRAVNHHGFSDRFEMVLGGNSVPRPKPNPDMLWAIMEGTGTQDLVMIGDTTYDSKWPMLPASASGQLGTSFSGKASPGPCCALSRRVDHPARTVARTHSTIPTAKRGEQQFAQAKTPLKTAPCKHPKKEVTNQWTTQDRPITFAVRPRGSQGSPQKTHQHAWRK